MDEGVLPAEVVEDVARVVRKAVLSRRPRSRYTVGPVAKSAKASGTPGTP